jgi:hypothetical protein
MLSGTLRTESRVVMRRISYESSSSSSRRIESSTCGTRTSSVWIWTSAGRRLASSRESPPACASLRLGDERAAPLDADHLAVVLEYRERLAHYDAAHAEASGQLRLRRQRLSGPPAIRLDLLLENLLQLVVQRHELERSSAPFAALNPGARREVLIPMILGQAERSE